MDILICNLDARATTQSLKGMFSEYGIVASAAIIVKDIIKGQRIGWVVMNNGPEAMNAVDSLHNVIFRRRTLGVNLATLRVLPAHI